MKAFYLVSSIFLFLVVAASAQSELPLGEGRDLANRVCSSCHGLDVLLDRKLSKVEWRGVVDEMVSRGAEGTDAEFDKVVEYLAKYLGEAEKINVNKAAAKELATSLGLSAKDGEAIVKYRQQNGNFKQWQELKKVPGIDVKKIEENKDRLAF